MDNFDERTISNERVGGRFEKVSLEEFTKQLGETCAQLVYDSLTLPRRSTPGSAGYDFYSPMGFELKPGDSIVIPTGIRCYIKDGWFLGILPRSGQGFKCKVQLYNTMGIIDSDYYMNESNEGHIMIKLYNDSPEGKTLTVDRNQAFAQGIFLQYGITEDDDPVPTERTGGFGSTSN